jgi:hypothetical protein
VKHICIIYCLGPYKRDGTLPEEVYPMNIMYVEMAERGEFMPAYIIENDDEDLDDDDYVWSN